MSVNAVPKLIDRRSLLYLALAAFAAAVVAPVSDPAVTRAVDLGMILLVLVSGAVPGDRHTLAAAVVCSLYAGLRLLPGMAPGHGDPPLAVAVLWAVAGLARHYRRSQERSAGDRRRLQGLCDEMPYAYGTLDADGALVALNRAGLRRLGLDRPPLRTPLADLVPRHATAPTTARRTATSSSACARRRARPGSRDVSNRAAKPSTGHPASA